MLPSHLKRNEDEIAEIERIAAGGDRPVLMLNINGYKPEAGYPDRAPYVDYLAALTGVLAGLGARIAWRAPVHGQPVGEQTATHEVLAIWYPSHQAFLDFGAQPGAKENYRLRALCVARAVIHRCSGEVAPLA